MSDHKLGTLKGQAKEAIGDISGDKGLQIEGKLDQVVASARKQIDKANDKFDEFTNPEDDVHPKQ